MLQLEDVGLSHSTSTGESAPILQGVTLTVEANRFTVIVGPSGGGKSSLLRLLNRLSEASRGRILFHGAPLEETPVLELRRRIGLVGQKAILFPGSVWHNLCQAFKYRKAAPPAIDSELVRQLIDFCGMEEGWMSLEARSLSGGQQHRVSLARTLMNDPEVLLLDEPTSALDRPSALRLGMKLKERVAQQGLTVVMVTHDLELARRCADHVVFLAKGAIVEQGEVEQVLNDPKSTQVARFLADPEMEGLV